MILPIVAYGSPVLRKVCEDIPEDYPDLQKFIEDMWETMYNSNGVGLAAPQVNRAIRLFVVDSMQIFENQEDDEKDDYPDAPGYKGVFINAQILEKDGEEWSYNEGCLSIPKIREDIMRQESIKISFYDVCLLKEYHTMGHYQSDYLFYLNQCLLCQEYYSLLECL